MEINLSELDKIGNFKEIKRKINFQGLNFRNKEIKTPAPFELKLDIYNSQDSFTFTGTLKGELILECSRCLEEFSFLVDVDIQENLPKEDIEDINNVEISDFLKKNIFLSIPIKPLCSGDCKGLCPECGQNLNYGQCECEPDNTDPRMAKLKELIDDED